MSEVMSIELTAMAHGGSALGRDSENRVVFTPYGIPGELVSVQVVQHKGRYIEAELLTVLRSSADRVEPLCPHFGICSGCHFQHISYERQLALKQTIIREQMARIGHLEDSPVQPVRPNLAPFDGGMDITLSPIQDGGAGLWSAKQQQVIPLQTCRLITPDLQMLLADLDVELPELRSITLRQGSDGSLMAALETWDIEPPEIEVDMPVSLALVLPDGVAASLIGDRYLVRRVKGRSFRFGAGVFFYPNLEASEQLVDTVLALAELKGAERVLELHNGAGMLTAFLAEGCAELVAVEANEDAVDDAANNLADGNNISLYQAVVEEMLSHWKEPVNVVVADCEEGLSGEVLSYLGRQLPERFIAISHDAALLARDARALREMGFGLEVIQPIDMWPQTFQTLLVSLWRPRANLIG